MTRKLPCGGLMMLATSAVLMAATPASQSAQRVENFDREPGWEAFNNRLKPEPKDVHMVVQDFGYSETSFAGAEKG
jgi:hypothetical protein